MSYLEAKTLSHTLGIATFTAPATLYFIASTAAFDPTLTGTSVVEPSADPSYARVAITNSGASWTTPTGSNPASSNNSVAINFATATIDWGTVLSVYAGDAATLGNLLYGTAVSGAGVPITTLSTFSIPIGAFVIRET